MKKASKYIQKAEEAYYAGKLKKAERYLQEAERVHPSQYAKNWQNKIRNCNIPIMVNPANDKHLPTNDKTEKYQEVITPPISEVLNKNVATTNESTEIYQNNCFMENTAGNDHFASKNVINSKTHITADVPNAEVENIDEICENSKTATSTIVEYEEALQNSLERIETDNFDKSKDKTKSQHPPQYINLNIEHNENHVETSTSVQIGICTESFNRAEHFLVEVENPHNAIQGKDITTQIPSVNSNEINNVCKNFLPEQQVEVNKIKSITTENESKLVDATNLIQNLVENILLSKEANNNFGEYAKCNNDYENNKEEANKSINIALEAISAGNLTKAEHFLIKAERICPSENAKILLLSISGSNYKDNTNNDLVNNMYNNIEPKQEINYEDTRDEAEKSIDVAIKAISIGDYKKSERFLKKAERLCPTKRAKELLKLIPKSNSRVNSSHCSGIKLEEITQPKLTICHEDTKDNANKCLEIAQNAITDGNFKKAERFLKKAERFCPTEHAKNLLKQIPKNTGNESSNTKQQNQEINDYTKDEAIKSIEVAQKAITDGDFKKAEQFLAKAERLHPTKLAKDLLKEISNKTSNENNNNINLNISTNIHKVQINEQTKEEAEKSIEIALKAIATENFQKAILFLNKSERLYPTERAKNLLKQISKTNPDEYINIDSAQNANDKKNAKQEINENNKDSAEKSIEIAQKAMSVGDLKKATKFLKKAERFYPTEQAKTLLKQISIEKTNKIEIDLENRIIQAETCIELAQNALSDKLFPKARRMLLKSERLYPTTRAKDLLKQLESAVLASGEDIDASNTVPKVNREKGTKKNSVQKPRVRKVTAEQLAAIERVNLKSTDLFEILGMQRTTNVKTIKTEIRKLRLLLHPDRNPDPRAVEAFMAVTDAAEKIKKLMDF